jgi:hypothetical protein
VSLFAFVREVVNILAILPQGHALVVMPPALVLTNPVRITNEESANTLFHAEIDDLTSRFMAQITNTTLGAAALLIPGLLQLLPPPGVFFATTLFPGNLTELLMTLSFERTNAASGDNECFARIGGDRRQMDLS